MPIRVPVVQTGLEASIQAAAKKAGRGMKVNMGAGAKSIDGLSQPLGRITGKADQFTKSMEAANARVLAFGASVGVLSAVTRGFKELVTTTIEVEKALTNINSILNVSAGRLDNFKKIIFDVARNTEQSFGTVAQAALELSRQGLKAEEVTKRLSDAMILSRLSGLGAAEAVAGLTAAINSFNREGVTSEHVLNKLSAAAVKAAVSEKDLIEGIKRSASVAVQAGVSLDELVGVITAVQQKTARGGAVIGNSFKTIFTRIQSLDKLKTMQNLGVEVTDLAGGVLSGTKLIENLANTIKSLPDARKLQIAEGLVGKFQVAPFLAILDDYSQKTSTAIRITGVSQQATQEAYTRNVALNQTLSAALNETVINVKELANTLGEIGVTDNLKNVLSFFSSLVEKVKGVMEGEGIGSDFARGIVKGIGNIISGPGLAIAGAIIAKLSIDLARFGVGSLQTFFGLNRAAKEQAALQGQIASTLLGSKSIQAQIMAIENSTLTVEQKRLAQTRFFTTALNEQMAIMTRMQAIAARVAPGVMRGTAGGRGGKAAGGYVPNFNATLGYGSEQGNINRGVGGAPRGARPVTMPNFNFGGGQRGTMVANDSEYVVDNFKGSGGSAVFNQNMVSSMGLPTGARKIGAAGGYIPNFASPTMMNKMGGYVMLTGERANKPTKQTVYTGIKKKTKATRGYNLVSGIDFERGTVQAINVPIHGLPSQAETKGKGESSGVVSIDTYKEALEKNAVNQALTQARALSGGKMPTPLKRGAIENKINQGALKGFAGTIYELTLATLLTDKEFKKYIGTTDTSNFDLNLQGQEKLKKLYNITGNPRYGEVKGYKGPDNIKSVAAKIFRVMGPQGQAAQTQKWAKKKIPRTDVIRYNASLGGSAGQLPVPTGSSYQITGREGSTFLNSLTSSRGGGGMMNIPAPVASRWTGLGRGRAGGYIPNFASPLEDAIGRERNAGLPLNQIRVNQSPRLRNAGNPQGLGVTNMRDEPTGRIPSFAKTDGSMTGASGDLMMKFMGLTMAASMLQGVFSEVGDETSNFSEGMSKATQALMMMAMMSMMGGGGLGFKPAAAGPLSQRGSSLLAGPMPGGDPNSQRFQQADRAARNAAARGDTSGAARHAAVASRTGPKASIGARVGGGALKGASMFGRLLPVIGQISFAFMGLSAVVKMFGGDLGKVLKPITDVFKKMAMSVGLMDTPAVKAAKALDKLTDATYKAAVAQGGFSQEGSEKWFKDMRTFLSKQRVEKSGVLSKDEIEKGKKEGKDVRQLGLEKIIESGTAEKVKGRLLDRIGFNMEVGHRISSEKRDTTEMGWFGKVMNYGGRTNSLEESRVNIPRGSTREEIREIVEAEQALQHKKGGGFVSRGGSVFKAGDGVAEEIEIQIAEILSGLEDSLKNKSGSDLIEHLANLGKRDDITGVPSAGVIEAMGGLRGAAIGSLADEEGRKKMAVAFEAGPKEMKKVVEEIELGFPDDTKKKLDEVYTKMLTDLEALTEGEKLLGVSVEERLKNEAAMVKVGRIKEKLAKLELTNMVSLQKLQSQRVSGLELEMRGRLTLLSISGKERANFEATLRIQEQKRNLVGKQIAAASGTIQDEGSFKFQMESKDVQEEISTKEFEAIKSIIGDTNQLLIEKKGWSKEISDFVKKEVFEATNRKKVAGAVVDLLQEQMNHLDKINAIEELGVAKANFRKGITESTLKTQKRMVANMKTELSVETELLGNSLAHKRIAITIAELEGKKIGKGKGGVLAIEKQITKEKLEQARLELEADQKRIKGGFKESLFADAQAAGLNLGQLGVIQKDLKGADTEEEFLKIINKMEEFSKKEEKAKIKGLADEQLAAIERARQLDLSADYFYDSVAEAGRAFAAAFKAILPANFDADAIPFFGESIEEAAQRKAKRVAKEAGVDALVEKTVRDRNKALRKVRLRPEDVAQINKWKKAVADGTMALADYEVKVLDLKNSLAASGDILNTFAKQVADFVYNLRQAAEDLKFRSYATTDPMGILADARDKTENTRLQALSKQGLTPEEFAQQGIAAGAESKAIQGLKDQAFLSPTAAGARSFTRQIPVLEEIFEVKKKFLAGTISEEEATERLLVLEKKRLQVNESLSAKLKDAFVFTQEEIQNNLTTELVSGAKRFTETISDGLVDAIAKGENLGDTLRSAATEFFRGMAKSHMSAAMDQLTSALGGGGGGGGWLSSLFGRKNSGGLIAGGSGTRDDVPTLLTGGEFVIRRGAVERYGAGFLEELNTGRVGQMGGGGLFTPGTYGQGAISGQQNLLDFATQSFTTGQFDRISSGEGLGSVSLEPQSGALTMFARRNSPIYQREQQSREEAFGLFVRQTQYEEQLREQEEAEKKAFMDSLISAVVSVGASQFATGFSESMRAGQGVGSSIGAGFTGFEFEGDTFGGLLNFTGGGGTLPSARPGVIQSRAGDALASLRATVDEQIDERLGGAGGFSAGGYVSPSAGIDTVPAMVSGGEFVMNAAATQNIGRGNLTALNSGGGGNGGDDAIVNAINNLGNELGGSGESVINITVNSDGTQTQDSNGSEEDQNLAARLGDSVRQIIAEEQRLGGSLRRA